MKRIDEYMPRIMLTLMAMAVALSAWHVGWYMHPIEGGIMATVFGVLMGAANLACAYYVFDKSKAGMVWPMVGLAFFSAVSTLLQHEYFGGHEQVTNEVAAWSLSVVAPSIEIILGGLVSKLAMVERDSATLAQELTASNETLLATVRNLTERNQKLQAQVDSLRAVPVADTVVSKSVSHPSKSADGKLSKADRQLSIYRKLMDVGTVNLTELTDEFGVSINTVKGDIKSIDGAELTGDGYAKYVNGVVK